jgi:hypothetical protein
LDYIDVATRIVEFREKYPEGSLQQVDLKFIDFAGKSWVVFTAAAFRSPDDERPGIGTAWEPVPGPTQFTRDSEVQNAETAAWGRAMVAALAVDTRKGIASSEEVRNRQAQTEEPDPKDWLAVAKSLNTRAGLRALYREANLAKASKEVLDEITKQAEAIAE